MERHSTKEYRRIRHMKQCSPRQVITEGPIEKDIFCLSLWQRSDCLHSPDLARLGRGGH